MRYWDYTSLLNGAGGSISFKMPYTQLYIYIEKVDGKTLCTISEGGEVGKELIYTKEEMIKALEEAITLIGNNGKL